MSSLSTIDTTRARAISRPGTKEWCELVEGESSRKGNSNRRGGSSRLRRSCSADED